MCQHYDGICCLETENLVHQFADGDTVLKEVSLKVPAGSVYGFLGPNGAGKTTTLKLVLGLLKKQKGNIRIFGQTFEDNRIAILKNTGSMIESPAHYGHLTATENLQIFQKYYQCPKENIPRVLELVGLSGTGNKKTARFSLGMKQRLGIAMALLHEPSLLVLDEPTNGLDPNGIIEVRELLKKLNQEHQVTVVISSHLLGEMEKMVTDVGIINEGALLYQGTLADLNEKQSKDAVICLKTSDPEKTAGLLTAGGYPYSRENEKVLLAHISQAGVAQIIRQLALSDIDIYEVTPNRNDLESIFMELIETKMPSS
jgi:lantibiotic transport system ATP-binding protein